MIRCKLYCFSCSRRFQTREKIEFYSNFQLFYDINSHFNTSLHFVIEFVSYLLHFSSDGFFHHQKAPEDLRELVEQCPELNVHVWREWKKALKKIVERWSETCERVKHKVWYAIDEYLIWFLSHSFSKPTHIFIFHFEILSKISCIRLT